MFQRVWLLVFLLLALPMLRAEAHGGNDHGGGSFPEPSGSSSGGSGSSRMFGRKANETADQVREELAELEQARETAVEQHSPQAKVAALDRKLERVRLRLEIAGKRGERADLRKRRDADGVARVERAIDTLKKKLRALPDLERR